jgi:hypothetical protein
MTTVQEHNATTGEVIIREMTEQELIQAEIDKAADLADKAAYETAQMAKESAQSKLAALGLTADELNAIGL